MYKYIAILFVSCVIVSSAATAVKKCKKGLPSPLNVNVEGCVKSPCNIFKGTTAIMDVQFLGTRDNITSLNAKVRVTAFGINVPYELPKDVADVCSNLLDGASCPINKGDMVAYKFSSYVEPNYPEIPVSIEVSLIDDNGESVACFIGKVRVKKAPKSYLNEI